VNDSGLPFVASDGRRSSRLLGSVVGERTELAEVDRAPMARPAEDVRAEGARAGKARAEDARADAFRRLVDRELDGAYRLAAVILDDRVEAEDAVHDAAISAWRRFADLRDPARFDAWFTRILVNGCRDRLRARARRRVVDVGRELAETEHPSLNDASDEVAFRDAVERALAGLPADDRVVLALRYDTDLTVPAIAGRLRIPEGTVKSRLHHALARLRAALPEDGR
jgi:RNA polymerase sigma-70 factor (ECF subfamily)